MRTRPNRRSSRALLGTGLALATLVPAILAAGPPWITIEFPPNPLDAETRGALVVVHTYHHASTIEATLRSHAVGIVDGESRSVELEIAPTSRPGAYVVRGRLGPKGAWVVVVEMRRGGEAVASALVGLERGALTAVRVPHRMQGRYPVPHSASASDIEAMLEDAVVVARARHEARLGKGEDRPAGPGLVLAGLLVGLVPVGILLRRRAGRPR